MFITTSFITAKTWKQLKYPSVGEWIKKLCYIQTINYYSALKRMCYQAMKRHGVILNAYCYLKENYLKRLNRV